jgi:hypothetical protein
MRWGDGARETFDAKGKDNVTAKKKSKKRQKKIF